MEEDEGLDELDRERASDMDVRPIYGRPDGEDDEGEREPAREAA